MKNQKFPIVTCPGCNEPMEVKTLAPMKSGDRMDEVTYRCARCGTETARAYKRSDQDARPPKT